MKNSVILLGLICGTLFCGGSAKAENLRVVTDKSLVEYLNSIIFMTNNFHSADDIKITIVRVRGAGECDSSDYVKTCPKEQLLIGVLLSGEDGDKAVYKTEGMYEFEFVKWRPDIVKPKVKYGYIPVSFEAKAQRVGQGYKLTEIKYLISVTPWSSQIEVIK